MTMRRECNKCQGTGTLRGTLAAFRKFSCDACNGQGFVEIDNVVPLVGVTRFDSEADNVLRHAIGELDCVVIVGYDKNGYEFYASSLADGANALWHLYRGIHNLMTIVDKGTDE